MLTSTDLNLRTSHSKTFPVGASSRNGPSRGRKAARVELS